MCWFIWRDREVAAVLFNPPTEFFFLKRVVMWFIDRVTNKLQNDITINVYLRNIPTNKHESSKKLNNKKNHQSWPLCESFFFSHQCWTRWNCVEWYSGIRKTDEKQLQQIWAAIWWKWFDEQSAFHRPAERRFCFFFTETGIDRWSFQLSWPGRTFNAQTVFCGKKQQCKCGRGRPRMFSVRILSSTKVAHMKSGWSRVNERQTQHLTQLFQNCTSSNRSRAHF